MIKRIYILLAFALVALGCSRELEPEIPQGESDTIVLELRTMDPVLTRAGKDGVKDGVTEYNENLIGSQVHLFFYANNATDDTPALKSLVANVNPTTRKVSLPTSVAEVRALFGGTNAGRKCKVFVVANYNGATAIDHDRVPRYTRNELKALELAAATWKDICDENGSFTPSDTPAFVMTGEGEIESRGATASPVVDGEVEMARVASKVSFSLTVREEIEVEIYAVDYRGNRIKETDPETGEWTGEYKKRLVTMKPSKSAMVVNLCFANKYATLSGESYSPTGTTDPKLFDYVYRPLSEAGTGLSYYTTQPFYSYPQKWTSGAANQPYLKLVIPWTPYDESGAGSTKNYYYKIPLPEGELKRNNWYQIALDVSILGGEEQEPIPVEIKYCVADWGASVESDAAVVSARYLSVPRKSFTMYNIEDLSIPMSSSHPCEIVNVTVSKPQYGSATYINRNVDFTNASLNDSDQLEVSTLNEVDLKHTLNNDMGSTMDVAPYTITFRVQQISDPDYYADITILQYPGIYIEETAGGNTFVDGFFGHLSAWPSNYSSSYIGSSNYSSDGYYYSIGWRNEAFYKTTASNNTPQYTPYNRLTFNNANGTHNLTRVTVTAFNESSGTYRVGTRVGNTVTMNDYTYIIGDPRVPSGWSGSDLVPYLSNMTGANTNQASSTSWTDAQAGAIMVGTSVPNIIAPSIYFASYWSRPQNTDSWTFEDAKKRCATYQEAGYPAGRWRIPTQAEVYFTFCLQQLGFIPALFSSGYGYYASDGSAFWDTSHYATNANDNGERFSPLDNNPHSVRCVYDVWYWGDNPEEDTTVYSPQP